MRKILHCDANNFYASIECMLDPTLKDKYVAVSGNPDKRHGIILAKIKRQKNAESRLVKSFGRQNANAPIWCLCLRNSTSTYITPTKFLIYTVNIPTGSSLLASTSAGLTSLALCGYLKARRRLQTNCGSG